MLHSLRHRLTRVNNFNPSYLHVKCINLRGLYEVLDLYPEYSHHFVQDIQQDLTYNLREGHETHVKVRLSTTTLDPQSGVRRNGQVVQGYPSIIEAQEEHEDDEEDEEEDRAPSVSPSSERNRAVNLRDASARSLLSGPSQRTAVQSSRSLRSKIQEITLTTLDPSSLSPRPVSPCAAVSILVIILHRASRAKHGLRQIVDGTEDSEGTVSSLAFSFSTIQGGPVSEPTSASASATDMLQISTAELAAKAEETRGQLRHLDQQVSSLGKEVADLGQVMKRMAHLMETLMSSVPAPSVDCLSHRSPTQCAYLSHPHHPHPSPPQTASMWTDTPLSLPSSPLTVPHQHSVMCHMDSLVHRPQDLQLEYSALPSSTPPPTPVSSILQLQPHMPSSPFSSPEISHHRDGACGSLRSRGHRPPLQDGGDEGPHQSAGCSPQTGLEGGYHKPNRGL
ncbi:unnamed protein product [Pleuronectes platessa]|uniref:Uncharacterized protein n=1 Tax=Pleuronectes platessa TaxID=8262 RepID=A0A9N7ZE11_PLEPL|nr:unnamed protein product [Pleuronectes platessa]